LYRNNIYYVNFWQNEAKFPNIFRARLVQDPVDVSTRYVAGCSRPINGRANRANGQPKSPSPDQLPKIEGKPSENVGDCTICSARRQHPHRVLFLGPPKIRSGNPTVSPARTSLMFMPLVMA
jgi:hypothetical protein